MKVKALWNLEGRDSSPGTFLQEVSPVNPQHIRAQQPVLPIQDSSGSLGRRTRELRCKQAVWCWVPYLACIPQAACGPYLVTNSHCGWGRPQGLPLECVCGSKQGLGLALPLDVSLKKVGCKNRHPLNLAEARSKCIRSQALNQELDFCHCCPDAPPCLLSPVSFS